MSEAGMSQVRALSVGTLRVSCADRAHLSL